MESKNKLWLGLGVVCIAGVTLSACSDSARNQELNPESTASAEGGEGGEGATTEDSIASDAVYLGQLAFIRGHLNVGVDLYRQGQQEAAATHMKHPENEIYTALLPAMEARNAPGFGEELQALALAVEQQQELTVVENAHAQLLSAVDKAEQAVSEQDAALIGAVIVDLVKTAAAEYDIAAGEDLALENAHEYQDALGFVRIAQQQLDKLAGMTEEQAAIVSIREQLELISPAWTGLQPPAQLSMEPSVLYGAASRIEIASLAL
ncbi:MAG: hypothetical protein RQ757_13170 [Pseudomonadales bacterium]|nr:hypothetical protein [Pseudomonadales bacterium]